MSVSGSGLFHPNVPTVITEDVCRFLDLVAGCHGKSHSLSSLAKRKEDMCLFATERIGLFATEKFGPFLEKSFRCAFRST